MRHAVPIYALREDGYPFCGAGFLLEVEGETWLTTAAHVVYRLERKPPKEWSLWPRSLFANDLQLSLFDGGIPRFKYVDQRDHIGDLLLLPLAPLVSGSEKLRPFHRFSPPPPPAAGSAVKGYGYPDREEAPWPERVFDALVLEPSPPLISFSGTPAPGFSGGPLVDQQGHLNGMTLGTDPEGRAVHPATIMRTLEQS